MLQDNPLVQSAQAANIICAVEEFLEDHDVSFFRDGIAMHRWIGVSVSRSGYIEK